MASDFLTTMRDEIDARLYELRPLVSEYQRLLAAVDALAGARGSHPPTSTSSSSPSSSQSSSALPSAVSPARAIGRRGPRGSAAGTITRVASSPAADHDRDETSAGPEGEGETTREIADTPSHDEGASTAFTEASRREQVAPKQERAARGAAQQAIVAALEHGSHTVGELVVVTAMTGANIRGNLRRLLKERTITRTKREGKAAYALASPPSAG